jgi:hypothetical protein
MWATEQLQNIPNERKDILMGFGGVVSDSKLMDARGGNLRYPTNRESSNPAYQSV